MKLTAFTDFSLRVLMYVGLQDGAKATVAGMASDFGISGHHLTKVVHFLGKAGLLCNVRGKGGGVTLAQPAGRIRLGQVVRLTEGSAVAAECFEPGGGDCCLAPACRLRDVLGEAFEAFYASLDRHTLADLLVDRSVLQSLLPAAGWVVLRESPRTAPASRGVA